MTFGAGEIATLTATGSRPVAPAPIIVEMLEALANDPGDATRAGGDKATDRLREAMQYSLRLRGKRARGLLVLLVTHGWGRPWRSALDCAHAVEMVHTASLIIDDLPCMDNAGTRRGEATNHIKFGEPVSILAAIALLSEAFARLATSEQMAPAQKALAIKSLSSAVGPEGMTAGQLRDLFPPGTAVADVELTHALKTGTLFAAASELGCICSGINGSRKWMLSDFGMLLGKAFQEFDDLLDEAGDVALIGKDTGKDREKPTIIDVLGFEDAEQRALQEISLALDCLAASGIRTDELLAYTLDITRIMRSRIDHAKTGGHDGAA